MPAVISTPRWQSWPMPACTPERGSSTPTFKPAPWARPMLNGLVPASTPAAPMPAANVRRDRPAWARVGLRCDLLVIVVLPLAGVSARTSSTNALGKR